MWPSELRDRVTVWSALHVCIQQKWHHSATKIRPLGGPCCSRLLVKQLHFYSFGYIVPG